MFCMSRIAFSVLVVWLVESPTTHQDARGENCKACFSKTRLNEADDLFVVISDENALQHFTLAQTILLKVSLPPFDGALDH